MKIKKIGHCCLLIQLENLTILTDPGAYSTGQNDLTDIDVILISHEHADHLHINSLQTILDKNPKAQIFTNASVGKILDNQNIAYQLPENDSKTQINGVTIEAVEGHHEEIFSEWSLVQNTGYLIDDKLFYPGDSFKLPGREIDILALPVAGPWCRVSEVVKYALSVKPKFAFPVHDGMLQPDRGGSYHKIPEKVLNENGIKFIVMKDGDEQEFKT